MSPTRVDLWASLARPSVAWSRREKLKRGLWELARALLFRPSPKYRGNAWRLWLLRRFGATLEGRALILPSARIWIPWHLELGDGVVIGERAEIYNFAPVRIGAMALISQDSCLCTASHDHEHPQLPLTRAPISVGAEAWIAARAFVCPGVSVGQGAVIGACSVVTRDMPPWTVCAGNPCRPLHERRLGEGAP